MNRPLPWRTKYTWRLLLALVCLLLAALSGLSTLSRSDPAPLQAQGDDLILSLRRDWGYGGFSGDIQGTFSFHVEAPSDAVKVEFYIDDQWVGTDTEAPWRYQFQTDNYALGNHQMKAIGHTASGATLLSNTVTNTFVAASEGSKVVLRIVVPIVGLVLLALIAGTLIEVRRSKRQTGPVKGRWGIALCPKCGQPFTMHFFALNVGMRKYDHCSRCGKWSVVSRASPEQLAAFEAAAASGNTGAEMASPDDAESRRRQRLEDSRFEDG